MLDQGRASGEGSGRRDNGRKGRGGGGGILESSFEAADVLNERLRNRRVEVGVISEQSLGE